jgi:hypothetical protein
MKVLALFLFVFLLIPMVTFGQKASTSKRGQTGSAVVTEPEEYRVYEAILLKYFGDDPKQTLVLVSEARGCGNAPDFLFSLAKKPDESIIDEMVNDCETKKASFALQAKAFHLKSKVALLSKDDLEKFFSYGCEPGWVKFNKRFPNSNGNARFSRVGFSKLRQFAAVSFGNQSGCLAGGGRVVLLEKKNDRWEVVGDVMTWVS